MLKKPIFLINLLVVLVVGFLIIRTIGGMNGITIAFESAPGINIGTRLMLGQDTVGRVEEVTVDRTGKILAISTIDRGRWKDINSSSVFIIADPDTTAPDGTRDIRIKVVRGDAPPFDPGARVEGYSSGTEFLIRYGSKTIEEALENLRGAFGDGGAGK